MAANKIVDGLKDNHYAKPKGTKFEKLLLEKRGWARKVNDVNDNGKSKRRKV